MGYLVHSNPVTLFCYILFIILDHCLTKRCIQMNKKILQISELDIPEFKGMIENIFDYKFHEILSARKNKKLSVKEAAKQWNCAELTIRNHIANGIIKASRAGRRILIRQSDLDAALSEVKSLKYKRA